MLQFESNTFLDDNDESFVSIDLNDDNNVCDICHQDTVEPIVTVMLRDEFLKFERSFERTGDSLTKAHQICIDRWSDIIERNLQFNKKSGDNDDISRTNFIDSNKFLKSIDKTNTINDVDLMEKDRRLEKSQHCKSKYY